MTCWSGPPAHRSITGLFCSAPRRRGNVSNAARLKFSTGGSKGCLAGQLICLIDVDGNVLPCSYFPKSAGNIREQSFKDIWENSKLFLELRDFKGYKDNCGRCEYVNVCGGCRARAYAMTGDYLAQEPFCSYQPGNLMLTINKS